MVYVTVALGIILAGLTIAAQAGPRRGDPAAQRPWYLAVSLVGILLAIAAVVTVLVR